MAKKIGIELEVEVLGQKKAVASIREVEDALQTLNEEIKDVSLGTKEFEDLQKEIKKLKGLLITLDKDLEGIDAEKRFQGIGAAIGFTTSSFQALSGVMGLVTDDTKSLEAVQKAEAAALNVINVAMGVNNALIQLNDARTKGLTLSTIQDTIAKYANAAATKIVAAATAAWNAILALNPIVAVVAGVAALTAGIYGLIKAYDGLFGAEAQQEKLVKAINKVENDLIKTKKDASKDLENQLTILTDNIKTRSLEKKTLEDLKKAYPGLNAFIDKNNNLTKKGIEFIKLEIALRQQQAALAVVQGKIAEKEIEFETKAAEIRQEYGASAAILIKELREKYDKELKPLTEVQNKYTLALDETIKKSTPYKAALDKQSAAEKVVKEKVDLVAIALANRNALIQQYIEDLKSLASLELEYTAEVLDKQDDILSRQESLIAERTAAFKTAGQKLREELGNLLRATIPNEKEIRETADRYEEIFDFFGEGVVAGTFDIEGGAGFLEFLNALPEELQDAFEILSEASQNALIDFFNNVNSRVETYENIQSKINLGLEDRETIIKTISDLEDELFDLETSRIERGKTEAQVKEEQLDVIKERFDIEGKIDALEKSKAGLDKTKQKERIAEIDKEIAYLKSLPELFLADLEVGIKFYTGIVKVQEQADEKNRKIIEGLEKLKAQLSPEEFDGFLDFFTSNLENFEVLFQDIINNFDDYVNKVGYENIGELFNRLGEGLEGVDEMSRKTLENLKLQLEALIAIGQAQGIDTTKLQDALDKVEKRLKKLPSEGEEAFMLAAQNISYFLDTWLGKVNELADRYYKVLQTRSSLYLEQLQADEEATLKAIGNTNKRAQELQAEAQKEFAKKRFEAEKKARIRELQFSLAQTISNEAAAIANVFATTPPPASFVLAGLIASLVGAQVLAVRNQLTFTKSQQFVGRRGGLITGQSHEGSNGGVPALLEGGEFVVNKAAVAQYGDLIGELNSSTGGRRLTIDDSRIVQTIASQNQNTPPLKAYVLYNSIQDTEKLNKRITQLSRL